MNDRRTSKQTELPTADCSGHYAAVEDLLTDSFLTVSPFSEDLRGRHHYSTLTANTQRQTADSSWNATMNGHNQHNCNVSCCFRAPCYCSHLPAHRKHFCHTGATSWRGGPTAT
ncbi:hypothetical protein INR49_018258 [Caranx melampygus]|nr:hypothetical protein INR49_018258 [Caranx melampygus]